MEGEMTTETEQAVRARAYEIWLQEGSPDGRDQEHWQQAQRELGAGPSDLERDPGIGTSSGTTGDDPEAISSENDTTPTGGVDPQRRGRTNK
jgi:hypothetical protein